MSRAKLRVLDAEVDLRVAEIRREAPDWPCKSGCADCCRSLAAPMLLSREEWARIEEGLATLPDAARAEIEDSFDAMDDTALRGETVACPILEDASSRCRIYAHRPLVCRSYGYYSGRDGGYWCEIVEARVDAGAAEGLIFGRREALERGTVRALGAPISWREWRGHTDPPSC